MSNLQVFFTSKKENWNTKNFLLYLATFFTTFGILFSFHLYYKAGYGNPLSNCLPLNNIIINSTASLFALYYLRHTKTFCLSSLGGKILLSISYGMCSYGIVQESLSSALFLYAFFPVLFLTYENMISEKKHLPFIITMTLALSIHPEGALPILFLLIILCIFDLILKQDFSLGNYIHLIACMVLSFLLAAFRIFPYLDSMYPASYDGYSTSYPFLMLLSRVLPFGSPSISFGTNNGIDVYTGLFLLILVIVFFISKKITKAKKIAYGFFMLLIYGVISISPLRFVFCLFTESNRFSVFFSFFLIFWIFRLAAEALSVVSKLTRIDVIKIFFLSTLYTLACFVSFRHNFTNFAFPVIFICITLYCFLIFLSKKGGKTFSICMTCIFILFLGEITVNTMVSTNLNLYPIERGTNASYIWNSLKLNTTKNTENFTTENTNFQEPSQEDLNRYSNFISTHRNEEDLETLDKLQSEVSLELSEYKELCNTAFPDFFQKINGAAQKIGCTNAIFSPASISITFEPCEYYSISDVSDNLFYFYGDQSEKRSSYYIVPFQFTLNEDIVGDLYIYNHTTNELFSYDKEQLSDALVGYTALNYNKGIGMNFHISTYMLNHDALQKVSSILESYTTTNTQKSYSSMIYVGIILSCIGLLIFFSLYFNSDKEKVYSFLNKLKEKLTVWKLPNKIYLHIKSNYVYHLAFLLPVVIFLITLIVNNCTPFGANSFFSGDGTALTLPSYWDCYYNLKTGNKYFSLNGGYGANQYAMHPFIDILSVLCLFEANQLPSLLLVGESICLGLCSFTMVFYLTHRISGKAAKKTDYRLLIAAFIYSLNAYMIAMHDFTSWYFVILAFPLLILTFERMIYKNKTLLYVLLLTFCISSNIFLALYMCIFLVISFFTCNFKGIKDFIYKGIRFALCSILAAGNSFFMISNTLLSTSDSMYRDADSVFPKFGLHTNFLEQWKRQMIFSVSHSVTSDEGMANLYFGIVTFFLILIFLLSKKYSWKDKLRKIIPMFILYVSFNEQVLSYLWNGLHYQSKVPNRFVFLLMFLVATISYDGICEIKKVSMGKFLGITVVICGFFLSCQFGSEGNQSIAWISSLSICILCFVCFVMFKRKKSIWLTRSVLILLIVEMCINTIYTFSKGGLNTILLYGNYPETTEFVNYLEKDTDYFRTTYPASTSALANSGSIFDTSSTDLFNSYITAHQNNLSTLLGFYSNVNIIKNVNNSTPFGLSLAGVRYIFYSNRTTHNIGTLNYYPYLGNHDMFYVYENPNALSLGFYVPSDILNLNVSIDNPIKFSNDFVSTYMSEDLAILQPQKIEYSSDTSKKDSFIFTDAYRNPISVEKAFEIYSSEEDTVNIHDLHMRIHFTSNFDGPSYLYANEFVGMGTAEANKPHVYDISFPNRITDFTSVYNVVTLDEKILNNFCDTVKLNQMENIEVTNDTITGTTNYAEDGYTMFSLAYDKGWHAYIDGDEVPIEDPYDAMMFIKTPKGKHTITLKYIPYGMKLGRTVSLIFVGITILIYSISTYRKRSYKKK